MPSYVSLMHAVLLKARSKMYPRIPQINCCIWSAFEELVFLYKHRELQLIQYTLYIMTIHVHTVATYVQHLLLVCEYNYTINYTMMVCFIPVFQCLLQCDLYCRMRFSGDMTEAIISHECVYNKLGCHCGGRCGISPRMKLFW